MIASSVVIGNLVYLIGAVVLAVVLGLAVTLRHRRPKSVEANMESFNKGLRALSPGAEPAKRRRGGAVGGPAPAALRSRTVTPGATPARPSRPVRTLDPGSAPQPETEAETG